MKPRALPKPTIRPATQEDLDRFYGKGKFGLTTTAMVGLVNGRIVGCGGIVFSGGRVIAFCDFKRAARRYKVSIVKAARDVIARARANGIRVMYADLDPKEPGADRWVRSLGFEPTDKPRIYRWMAK